MRYAYRRLGTFGYLISLILKILLDIFLLKIGYMKKDKFKKISIYKIGFKGANYNSLSICLLIA